MSILFVEDNESIAEGLAYAFKMNNYHLDYKTTMKDAIEYLNNNTPELIILDVSLPDGNGFNLYEDNIKKSQIPVIFLTARDDEDDIIKGLNLGAEDYMTKPFNPLEVVAYVKAVLRRSNEFNSNKDESNIRKVGELSLDLNKYILKKNNKVIPLTSTELKILALMLKAPGKVFTKTQIYEVINGDYYECDDNTIMVHISNIRSKIEDNPSKPIYIKTVRGLGYKVENKSE